MFEQLKELICNFVDVNSEDITLESRFIEDLGFNSFDFMSFLGEIEETMNVQIDDQEVINLHTVEEAIKYLESLNS